VPNDHENFLQEETLEQNLYHFQSLQCLDLSSMNTSSQAHHLLMHSLSWQLPCL
jgi:hypothetical protein